MPHIEELSCDIQRLQSREPRDFAQAFQPLAVTDPAWHRLSGLSAFDQRFASGNAAGRHVGDETGMRVADFRASEAKYSAAWRTSSSDVAFAIGPMRASSLRVPVL